MSAPDRLAVRLRIRGLVQGVGFRPAIYRLAASLDLGGSVCNDGCGVLVHLEGPSPAIDAFRRRLQNAVPPAARIESITESMADYQGWTSFRIQVSEADEDEPAIARVPADRAMCADCQRDVVDPSNRRYRHAFASCTACGPRYSILDRLPYERRNTSMAGFEMCLACKSEYEAERDRRFHAEPIACPDCGPQLTFKDGIITCAGWNAIDAAAVALRQGRIVALKGLGGYQLLVRADEASAVSRLRQRKQRPTKPFALMVSDFDAIARIAFVSSRESECVKGADNPIVLLRSKGCLPDAIAPGLRQLGVLLPTTPLHLLLLSQLDFPVVATSGNRSDEPIAIDEAGRDGLASIADAFLDHNRPIGRRVDDSVIRVIADQPMTVRLARGLAPCVLPDLEAWANGRKLAIPAMLAVGGQQKCALAIWTGTQAVLSHHLGDMDEAETRAAFVTALRDLERLYRCDCTAIAHDLHPDYFTTRWASTSGGRTSYKVQHHHAHAAACMVEHGLLDKTVLAVIFDGTGFGTDNTIWGGEILQTTITGFQRVASLDVFALPGGEAAIREPRRIAVSLLAQTFGLTKIPSWLLDRLGVTQENTRTWVRMIERGVNSPLTSSIGRLFDGVAALLLQTTHVNYEGEAALWLESVVDPDEASPYDLNVRLDATGVARADWRSMIRSLVEDIASGVASGICAARFHNALAHWTTAVAATNTCDDVVLGGGCFQNAYLTTRIRNDLQALGKNVHVPSRIPANDGGLAAGQLAIAMAHYHQKMMEEQSCVSPFRAESLIDCR